MGFPSELLRLPASCNCIWRQLLPRLTLHVHASPLLPTRLLRRLPACLQRGAKLEVLAAEVKAQQELHKKLDAENGANLLK